MMMTGICNPVVGETSHTQLSSRLRQVLPFPISADKSNVIAADDHDRHLRPCCRRGIVHTAVIKAKTSFALSDQ